MNTLRDAAQKALDAWDKWDGGTMDHAISPAIEVLRTALAEQIVTSDCSDSHQPVAWGYRVPADGVIIDCITPEEHAREEGEYTVPLYAAPRPRPEVELTDEDILHALMLSPPEPSLWPHLKGQAVVGDVQRAVIAIARAIIAAYRAKQGEQP
jgi:hypothetical protein